jgi:penicillin-binding protein 1C
LLDRLFPPPLTRLADLSVTVVDRSGAPLKVFAVIYMPLPGAKP